MHIVDIGRCKQVRTILRPFVIYFVNMVTFKLPFGRPNDAIHIRAAGSFRPNTKIVRILFFWLRLIACFARALALCLRVNGKTQWIEHQTPKICQQKWTHAKGQTFGRIYAFSPLKINHFHKTDFQSFVVLSIHSRRNLYLVWVAATAVTYNTIFSNIRHRIYGWLIELWMRSEKHWTNRKNRGKSWNQLNGGFGGCTRPTQDSLCKNQKHFFSLQDWSISSSFELIEIRYDARST